ncbi:MAG: threonine/serine dehydratase, partial [Anaerolineales bacterium]|nr:threonine/serine dehydratase [Anaerolineales bacterium]
MAQLKNKLRLIDWQIHYAIRKKLRERVRAKILSLPKHQLQCAAMIAFQDILRARATIQPHIFRTPLRESFLLSERVGASVYLKLENWQITGSFKLRGALNRISQMTDDERVRGIVTASAGNHALGVGYAARALNVSPATIFVPRTAPRTKLAKLREFPVEVRQVGETYDDAHRAADAFARENGATFIHAYDDPRTVAGQGTIGLEILDDLPNVDAILVPVGGGGMITGIAVAAKTIAPTARIVAIQTDASPALRDSLRDNKCYEEYAHGPTICEGLAGGIGKMVFEAAQTKLIDDVVIVAEDDVRGAICALAETEQLIVEGSGAVGVAA